MQRNLNPTAHTTTCGSLNGSSATAALTIGVQLAEGFKMVPSFQTLGDTNIGPQML